jgi:ABC-2 type transport system permease protein
MLGDSVRYLVAGTVVVVVGVVLGFRPDAGVPGVVAAMLLVAAFSFGLAWVFTTVGMLLRSPNAVLNGGFMVLFPLTFVSNVFVDPDTLPRGLEWFVNANPISHLVTATRGLMEGSASAGEIAWVLATAAGLTAVFAPLTTHLYRTRT